MAKKGIAQITGSNVLKLGEVGHYRITKIYRKEDDHKVPHAKWKLYAKEKDGWRELQPVAGTPPKIGSETTITITNQKLLGKELLLEAFLYEPEKSSPPGIIIKVEKGNKKIERVDLYRTDNSKIPNGAILKYGQSIRVKVFTVNMPNEKVLLTLYEDHENGEGHSEKNEKNKVDFIEKYLDKDGFATHTFKLPIDCMKIANAYKDGTQDKYHEYYINVKSATEHKASQNVNAPNPDYTFPEEVIEEVVISVKAKEVGFDPIPKTGRSVSIVQEPPEKEKKEEVCDCKKYDLIWGKKVSCDFRKKVVEICKDLWGDENKIKMANNLMAVFRWESGGTFKPDAPNQANSGGTGLIQFMPSTAKSLLGQDITIEIVKNYYGQKYNKKTKRKEDWYLKRVKEFADMTAIEQLDYVKKYFEPLRNKEVEFVDFYLQVLFPASSRKEDHIVFASTLSKLTTRTAESEKLRSLRVNAYSQNSGLDTNKDGVVWKSEIKNKVQTYVTEGLAFKEDKFECGGKEQVSTPSTISKCPDDCSQCLDYSDVWENPVISSDNGGKNNNRYGYNSARGHKGIDILSGATYKDVHSLMCGEVVSLVNSFKTNEYRKSSLGNTLMIKSKTKDGETVFVLYCHLDKIYVKKGDKVKHGQKVALSGSTGNASYSGLPNGVNGHGIAKENWHCHIEAATKGDGYNNFYSLGSYRVKAEDYMKTKFDKDGNAIK